jgi:hypothetical protein
MFYSPIPTTFPHAGDDNVAIVILITVPARGQITNDDDDSDGHTTDSEEDYKTKGAPPTDTNTDDEDDVKGDDSGSEDEEFLEHAEETQNRTTASRRAVLRQPVRFQDGLDNANASINIQEEDVKTKQWLQEISAAAICANQYEPTLTLAKRHYYDAMSILEPEHYGCNPQDANEVAALGAGIGGGFKNTAELRPMKYNEAIGHFGDRNFQFALLILADHIEWTIG